ncbi:keratin-associated protein 5-10 [Drosophila guanche]|uniref:Blast:Keratin-associated protein 5-4 n=1 Tax=Drosophila guanche TaxID=7266 RepID=A0A3B0JAS4_DROGU|nr:keratin-associated protein 5-10 [Drosophila guanche]SPP79427.1 blast:Keratin-associated protein 5-4 [Drosophila guanche]
MGSHTFFTTLIVAALALSQLDSCLAIQCYDCNSGNNANCLTTSAGLNEVACSSNCFTSADANGVITRGCLAESANCTAPLCNSCNTDKCNTNLVCYICTGESCNAPTNATLGACGTADGQCYTIGTSAADMQRGCTSDTGAKCPKGSADTNCAICQTTNCNSLQYERDAGSCIQCTDCAGAQEASTAKTCGTVKYNQESLGCYTLLNGTVSRGCITTGQAACTTESNCTACSGAACNLAAQGFQCAQCNTLTNDNCRKGVGTPVTSCANTCFSGYWNGAGIRGCWDDASELMQYQCVNEKSHDCSQCQTSLCNVEPFSGAATIKQLGVGLLLGLALALRYAL